MEKEHYTRADLVKALVRIHNSLSDTRLNMYYANMSDFEKYMIYKKAVKDTIDNIEKIII